MLKHYNPPPDSHIEPGVFLNVLNHGVLLRGPSAIGKSELALVLIRNGHQLVSDDAVILHRDGNSVVGTCPPLIKNLLEIRGLGIIDVKELFGEKAICKKKKLDLIIKLVRLKDTDSLQIDRIEGMYQKQNVLGTDITEITLPVAPGRGLSVLVEVAIRNHILRSNGYNAADTLKQRQLAALEESNEC